MLSVSHPLIWFIFNGLFFRQTELLNGFALQTYLLNTIACHCLSLPVHQIMKQITTTFVWLRLCWQSWEFETRLALFQRLSKTVMLFQLCQLEKVRGRIVISRVLLQVVIHKRLKTQSFTFSTSGMDVAFTKLTTFCWLFLCSVCFSCSCGTSLIIQLTGCQVCRPVSNKQSQLAAPCFQWWCKVVLELCMLLSLVWCHYIARAKAVKLTMSVAFILAQCQNHCCQKCQFQVNCDKRKNKFMLEKSAIEMMKLLQANDLPSIQRLWTKLNCSTLFCSLSDFVLAEMWKSQLKYLI